MRKRILIIGIDGLEPNLVEDWIEDLPNISAFIKNGVFGRLKSSIPPVSSLYLYNVSIPKYMDGEVLFRIFEKNFKLVSKKARLK